MLQSTMLCNLPFTAEAQFEGCLKIKDWCALSTLGHPDDNLYHLKSRWCKALLATEKAAINLGSMFTIPRVKTAWVQQLNTEIDMTHDLLH